MPEPPRPCAVPRYKPPPAAQPHRNPLSQPRQPPSARPRRRRTRSRGPCDEVYVVGEGETLHTISDKCGDPFIVERNPHVHDPDDVFPGLVLALRPTKNT
ncbi:uncharacterized protein LOC119356021 isoform X2 [Triticum dicoccoides]|uniref:uncharacterized protein LOC119356021 isoform X2 n=1 Tax=Triticum dicoccoides TaxID=85692 RepID=UPI00188ECAFE|nr:uncharacterized protein LOC119356021 isoform X2 [Triticum dicoccoides]